MECVGVGGGPDAQDLAGVSQLATKQAALLAVLHILTPCAVEWGAHLVNGCEHGRVTHQRRPPPLALLLAH